MQGLLGRGQFNEEEKYQCLVALIPWEAIQISKGPGIHILIEVILICSQG